MNIDIYIEKTETELKKCCDKFFYNESSVAAAAKYSLLDAGKRVRAVLLYLTAEMTGENWQDYSKLACAVEMVHCYSLIHDDLPCMDNDDFRRGKPSCHKAYNEDTALLAGDALIGCSIEVISHIENLSFENRVKAIQLFCAAIGPKGMIYGQELDLKFEKTPADKAQLEAIHKNKTGQLISLCGKLGSINANLSKEQENAITVFFANIGMVFQIIDDILDVEGSAEDLGKPVGSDFENNKSTFVSLYGLEESKKQGEKLTTDAIELLKNCFGVKGDKLISYTQILLNRRK